MKYNPSLGIFGNITKLFEESTKTNNTVYNNKSTQDTINAESQEDFDNMILDYEERLILLEVGE